MELFKLVYSKEECWVADGTLIGATYSMINTGTITTDATKYNKSMIKWKYRKYKFKKRKFTWLNQLILL